MSILKHEPRCKADTRKRALKLANQAQFDRALESARVLGAPSAEEKAIRELAPGLSGLKMKGNDEAGSETRKMPQPDEIAMFWQRVFRAFATRNREPTSVHTLTTAIALLEQQFGNTTNPGSSGTPPSAPSVTQFICQHESLRLEPNTKDVRLVLLSPSGDASPSIRCDVVNISLGGFLSLCIK